MRSALPFVTAAALILASAPFGTPAFAEDGAAIVQTQTPRFERRERASGPQIDCTCRYRDRDIGVGETVCMNGRVALCGMVLNNTSWSFTDEACPIAAYEGGDGPLAARN